jgi:hypothetical protein
MTRAGLGEHPLLILGAGATLPLLERRVERDRVYNR